MVFLSLVLLAQQPAMKEVAITIDDLPFAQSGPQACDPDRLRASTGSLLAPLRGLPFTGFVVGTNCSQLTTAQRRAVLRLWIDAGGGLGNHTQTHPDYNRTSSADYLSNIAALAPALRAVTGKPAVYFRSPMLHTGDTPEKKSALAAFLRDRGLKQAPVTFDNSEWMFAAALARARAAGNQELAGRILDAYVPYMESTVAFLEQRALEVVGRPIKHVLLIHANQLNAEKLGDLLGMFRRRGYRFISLDEALTDPAYSLPDPYVGPKGFSWIHRWAAAKGMPEILEPDEPAFVRQAYETGR